MNIDILMHDCQEGYCTREGCCGDRNKQVHGHRLSMEEKKFEEEQELELDRYLIKPVVIKKMEIK